MKLAQTLLASIFALLPAHLVLADVATEADVIDMIETCIAFVNSDTEHSFPDQWSLTEYEERDHRANVEIRIDRELVNLQYRAEIKADDRIETQTRAVIDRQCLIVSVFEAAAVRNQSSIDGYTAIEPVEKAVVEQAAIAFMAQNVAVSRYVDYTEMYQGMYPNDPPEAVFQSCSEPSTLIKVNIYEEGSIMGWDWSISVVRRDTAPEGCARS